MKKSLLVALTAGIFGSFTTSAFAQGIPVTDVTQIGNQIKEYVKEAQRWQQQLANYKTMIETQAQQLASMTGVRDVAQFMQDAKKQYDQVKDLTKWVQNPELILQQGKSVLTPELRDIYDKYNITSTCDNTEGEAKNMCEGRIILTATMQQANTRAVNNVAERVQKINEIAKKMEMAKDAKESLDLSNSMQTQVALLNAAKTELDIQQSVYQQQQRLHEQQVHEADMKILMRDYKGRDKVGSTN